MEIIKKWLVGGLLGITLFLPLGVFGQEAEEVLAGGERILNFRSNIVVATDGSMVVTETIRVVARGEQIRRGIYRDFPTKYKDRLGNNYRVGFEVLSARRDGVEEIYRLENRFNGVRVNLGPDDIYLTPGVYEYEITYRTDRQLGFFEQHDELHWNVTGNDWAFVIEVAEASIVWPGEVGAEEIELTAYTGPTGATGMDFTAWVEMGTAFFRTTTPLLPGEGLTVVVGWPKGLVIEPTVSEKTWQIMKDNFVYPLGGLGFLLVFLYYFLAWKRVGVDPQSQAIITQYEPPQNLSPAAVRYINCMRSDNKALVASIINMAVKGYLKIEQLTKNYKLTKVGASEEGLSTEEVALGAVIFEKAPALTIESSNYDIVLKAGQTLAGSLKQIFKESYFVKNQRVLAIGIGWSVVALGAVLALLPIWNMAIAIFLTVFMIIWSLGLTGLFFGVVQLWKQMKVGAYFMTLFLVIFMAVQFGVLSVMFVVVSGGYVLYLVSLVVLNITFAYLLPRRTIAGARMNEEIEGFKRFLSATEKDRLNFHNPPDKTPELFEKFLPYALALEVENEWAEQFEAVFEALGKEGDYNSGWYTGRALSAGSLAGFTGGLSGSLAGNIASSSSPPGSSSGFGGGGGGSGGGGGGGGGGGR